MTLFQWLIFIWKLDLEKMTRISSTWFQSGLKRWPRVYFWQEPWCMNHAQFWTYHPKIIIEQFSIPGCCFFNRYIGFYYPLIWLLWGLYSANIRIFIHQSSISWFMSYQGFDVICSFAIPHAHFSYGCFLKWWVSPHFTPQVLIILSRKTHGFCWGNPPFKETPISRKPMMLSVWPYRVPLLRRPVVNLLLPHGHQQRLRSSRSAWNLGDFEVIKVGPRIQWSNKWSYIL